MHFRRVRLKKEYRFKVWLVLSVVFIFLFLYIPRNNRAMVSAFFSTKCRNYKQVNFSKRLNDRLPDYHAEAQRTGIERCVNQLELGDRISDGKIFRVRSTARYSIEDMSFSYPYLTKDSKDLLNEIAKRFNRKIRKEGLKGSRFIITSMTRTSENLRKLGGSNINASENSPHLNGNAFDISYARFSFIKLHVTECDKWYLKEALAEVIWELKKEKQCWATYERKQGCFHVVAR